MSQPNPERYRRDTDEDALRGFLARVLGWSDEQRAAVEHALRSIQLAITYRAALVLLGDLADVLTIAEALHRRILGTDLPFVVCDRYANQRSAVAGVQTARGGTLCVNRRRLPRDFAAMVPMVRDHDHEARVQLIMCGDLGYASDPFLALPVPIQVPTLAARAADLPRIVDEYARDAIATLDAFERDFTEAERAWVVEHGARTWADVEVATMRIVALRHSGSVEEAAQRLGMSSSTLRKWISNRRLTCRGKARP